MENSQLESAINGINEKAAQINENAVEVKAGVSSAFPLPNVLALCNSENTGAQLGKRRKATSIERNNLQFKSLKVGFMTLCFE